MQRQAPLGSHPAGLLMLFLLAAVPAADAQQVPRPRDLAYPGIIELQVDATNVGQKIFKVHERIPVKAGKIALLYPKWRLGAHSPAGMALSQFAGLLLTANRQRLEWMRDPLDVYAFNVDVPAGVAVLDADFEFLSPVERNQGAVLVTAEMLAVHWEAMLLYPAGYYAHGILFRPSVLLPPDWKFAGALESTGQTGAEVRFKPVNLEELIDSPIYAGRYFKRIDLDPGARVPVFLDMVADNPANLEGTAEQVQAHRALVQQAY